jgi:ArsR family transcriptional regulator
MVVQQDLEDMRMAAIAKALGHPARLRILRLLARTPGCIGGDIVEAVCLAQSTVSEHLRILKEAGVIEGEIDPPRVCYSLSPGALQPLSALIEELDVIRSGAICCVTPARAQG